MFIPKVSISFKQVYMIINRWIFRKAEFSNKPLLRIHFPARCHFARLPLTWAFTYSPQLLDVTQNWFNVQAPLPRRVGVKAFLVQSPFLHMAAPQASGNKTSPDSFKDSRNRCCLKRQSSRIEMIYFQKYLLIVLLEETTLWDWTDLFSKVHAEASILGWSETAKM